MNFTADAALHWLERLLEAGAADRQQTVWQALSDQPAALQAAVQRLWLASQSATGMLPQPTLLANEVRAGAQIGEHQLLSLLGSGGMAEVWLAERTDDLRREAIKFPTPQLQAHQIERFCRERSALARIEHPHVARLYNTGLTPSGRPYIVMEYVAGAPITEAADRRRWTLRERMAAFLQLLQAVDCVHRHLVVHRDIKPSNVLVDEAGQVRLLDFGIAKLIDDDGAAESSELTRDLPCEMTLRSAAPEQISGAAISTATDIYALGLLLFELLAGRSARADLAPTPVALAQWLHQGAPKMSSVVGTGLAGAAQAPPAWAATASARGTDIDGLRRALRGDLDTIVAKAMQAQPAARYASAAAFADDVSRWLALRPILARPPSLARRVWLFVRRQRVPVAVAAAGLALAMLLGAQAWQQQRAAQQSQSQAEAIDGLVASLLEGMGPDVAATRLFTAEELLDSASAYLDGDLALAAPKRRLVWTRVAHLYQSVGAFRKASERLAAVLQSAERAGDALATAQARLRLVDCWINADRLPDAWRELAKLPGGDLEANGADGPIALDRVSGIRVLATGDQWSVLGARADVLRGEWLLFNSRVARAEALLLRAQRALAALPADLEWQARTALARGTAARLAGNLTLARNQLTEAIALQQQRGAAGTYEQSSAQQQLGALENWAGRHEAAEQALMQAWTQHVTRQSQYFARAVDCATELIVAHARRGHFDSAGAWIDLVLRATDNRPELATARAFARGWATRIKMYLGDPAALLQLRAQLAQTLQSEPMPNLHSEPLRRLLAEALLRAGHDDEAWPLLRHTEVNQIRLSGEGHPSVAMTRLLLGVAQARQSNIEAARGYWARANQAALASVGAAHPLSLATEAYLAVTGKSGALDSGQRQQLADRLEATLGWQSGTATLVRHLRQPNAASPTWVRLPVVM